MFYTEHARMRITERNFSIDMIEDAMNLFSLHGKWDQKNERVTLHTNSDEFHSHLRTVGRMYDTLKSKLLQLKRTIKENSDPDAEQQEEFSRLKEKCKNVRKILNNLKKLEHKGAVTLVIVNNVVVTVFKPLAHFKSKVQ